MPYDKLLIASGAKPNKFGWPGQDLIGVQGLYSYQDLKKMEKKIKFYQKIMSRKYKQDQAQSNKYLKTKFNKMKVWSIPSTKAV